MNEEKAEEWANDILKLVKCRCELRDEEGDWWYMYADIEKYLTNEQMPGGWEKQIKEELDVIRNEGEKDSREQTCSKCILSEDCLLLCLSSLEHCKGFFKRDNIAKICRKYKEEGAP